MFNPLGKLVPAILLICCPALCHGDPQIRIINARVAEAPPVMEMNAAYLEIDNGSPSPITLIRVSSGNFSRIEIHQSVIEDGMARMKPAGPLTIPAHSQLVFKPGSYHLMLFQPRIHLHAGDTVGLRFHFADGTAIDVNAKTVKIE